MNHYLVNKNHKIIAIALSILLLVGGVAWYFSTENKVVPTETTQEEETVNNTQVTSTQEEKTANNTQVTSTQEEKKANNTQVMSPFFAAIWNDFTCIFIVYWGVRLVILLCNLSQGKQPLLDCANYILLIKSDIREEEIEKFYGEQKLNLLGIAIGVFVMILSNRSFNTSTIKGNRNPTFWQCIFSSINAFSIISFALYATNIWLLRVVLKENISDIFGNRASWWRPSSDPNLIRLPAYILLILIVGTILNRLAHSVLSYDTESWWINKAFLCLELVAVLLIHIATDFKDKPTH